MGLDMYLNKEIYVGANFEHRKVKVSIDLEIGGEKIDVNASQLSAIDLQVGYWRKANHIHKWFVDNVQDGEDECDKSSVSIEALKKLKAVCEQVLADNSLAEKLLPTKEGFFFGQTGYNEYYFKDIKDTLDIINPLISEGGTYERTIYYRSSW